jgi:HD domain-containing protein
MNTRCEHLVRRSISATTKPQATLSVSVVIRSRLPGQWNGRTNSWVVLREGPICTILASSESPTEFYSSRDLSPRTSGKSCSSTPRSGLAFVKDIPFLADAAEIILTHHERYDGAGYPRGLKGEEVLLSARIFAIADTLDAITSDRPYRRASSFQPASETIRHLAGSQFDPHVLNVFLSIPEETWPTIARNQRQVAALPSEIRRNFGIFRTDLRMIP